MIGSRKILLVDDENGIKEVALEMLREHGFTVIAVGDGRSALDILSGDPGIELLVTDVVMPELNGFQLAHRARALPPTLPILYISGYADQARLAAEAVHGPILRKPFRAAELVECVRSMLHGRSRGPT